MQDEFQQRFWWIAGMLEQPTSAVFAEDSQEYQIMQHLKSGWGKTDTAELLRQLTAEYGENAIETMKKYLANKISKDWAEIGKAEAKDGTEIEDFIRVLWGPLKEQGFEYTQASEDGRAKFHVTKCPLHDLAQKTGLHEWLYCMGCFTDFHMTPSFSSKIVFERTRTLMEGHDHCNHAYSYQTSK